MAQIPENEHIETEEFSTIFSDPAAHRNITPKKKKLLPKILAGVLALAVLAGGTAAVIKFIPVLDDGDTSSTVDMSVEVKNLKTDSISAVTVENSIGTTEIYGETQKEDDKESSVWKIKGLDGSLTQSSSVINVVEAVGQITADRSVTQKTAEECGLNSPTLKATVTPKKGEGYTVLIGSKSPDNTGYYLQIADKSEIYLVDDNIYSALDFQLLDFATTEAISGFKNVNAQLDAYFANGQIAKFDRLTLKGNGFGDGLEIIANTDSVISEYYGYIIKQPKRIAKNFEAPLGLYQNGITVAGAYAFDTSTANIKKFGLDNPDLEMTMYAKDKSLTYKFALQNDGNYAVISDDSKLIHMVYADSLTGVVQTKTTDFYSEVVFITSIDKLKDFKVTAEDKTYNFAVETKSTEDEDGNTQKTYTVTLDGKKIDTSNFQSFYEKCVSIDYTDFTADKTNEAPKLIFDVTLNNGGKTKLEFSSVSATKFNCKIDGVELGKVTATQVNGIIDSVKELAK